MSLLDRRVGDRETAAYADREARRMRDRVRALPFHDRNIQFSNQMMFDSFKKEIGESLGNNESFALIGLTELRNDANFAGIDGSGLSVAVIDSGIDTVASFVTG